MAGEERKRLAEDARGEMLWRKWGPYLAERSWGTVREDYSPQGTCWDYFPHDHARSRAYRWVEDGLLGIADDEQRLCFALGLWNEQDPILKERLFGLHPEESNHGESVKERYAYCDATPTSSYLRAIYRYPHAAFPYARLVEESRRRGRRDPELTLEGTGVLDGGRYFDVEAEYAKASPEDILIRFTVHNRGPEARTIHLVPTLWFRNTWSWDGSARPSIAAEGEVALVARHADLGAMRLAIEPSPGRSLEFYFTENDTNMVRIFGGEGPRFAKDAIANQVLGRADAANRKGPGTKAAAHVAMAIDGGASATLRLRLTRDGEGSARSSFDDSFDATFAARIREADELYAERAPRSADARMIRRKAYAGLLHSAVGYRFDVAAWQDGDPKQPRPPEARKLGRNRDWRHLSIDGVLLVPDAWEYPWFAAWDLAFHAVAVARLDPDLAKRQLEILLAPGALHPNGQIPAYEFAFSDANPPVHAWAALLVYEGERALGRSDRGFLARVFQPLLANMASFVSRAATHRANLYGGGFLGLDNVGPFDRGRPLPDGAELLQADGTGWVAFFAASLLGITLELARTSDREAASAYELTACRLFDHLLAIAEALNYGAKPEGRGDSTARPSPEGARENTNGDAGLWSEEAGLYVDHVVDRVGNTQPIAVRSIVGVIPILAAATIDAGSLDRFPLLGARVRRLVEREHPHVTAGADGAVFISAVPLPRLVRVLGRVLDEAELLSPFGVRSLSLAHRASPFRGVIAGMDMDLTYAPNESTTVDFGANSNWRGPVWLPMSFLVIDALRRYARAFGETLVVACPTGSDRSVNLGDAADEIARRVLSLFLRDASGRRPSLGGLALDDDLLPFREYFGGDDGRGCGASAQGWTALVARLFEDLG